VQRIEHQPSGAEHPELEAAERPVLLPELGCTNTLTNVAFSIPALYNADQTVINGDYLINSKNTLGDALLSTRAIRKPFR
jgi:hypothetical protein